MECLSYWRKTRPNPQIYYCYNVLIGNVFAFYSCSRSDSFLVSVVQVHVSYFIDFDLIECFALYLWYVMCDA